MTIDKSVAEFQIPVVTFNSDLEESGRTAAGLMGEILGEKGTVGIISGHINNLSLNNRVSSFMAETEESFPEMEVLEPRYAYDDNWVSEKITEELLRQYPQIGGIYISGSGVVSVCHALENMGKGREIKVIANDFLEENIHWLKNGTVNFLIGQDAYVQGYDPVMILFRKLFENQEPEKTCCYTEIVIKTKYNA